MFTEQIQETQPCPTVGFGITVLCGIAAGCVEQYRVIGKPPVTISGAADTADLFVHLVFIEGEFQPGGFQQGCFATARGANNDVPGQFIQVLLAKETALQTGLFQVF